MTITDSPEEDAAGLDDDALFEAYLAGGPPQKEHAPPASGNEEIAEWPSRRMREVGLAVDVATLAWFKTNHADWRREMGFVLRAWAAAARIAANDGTAET